MPMSKRRASASEPALVLEEADHPDDHADHQAGDDPEGEAGPLARKEDVHAEDPGDEGERKQDHGEHRQDPQDVVLAVRDHGLVRALECFHDFLVVVQQVPDALGRIDEVVEVKLELLGEEALDVPLEQSQCGTLWLDDLAVGDDLLLHLGDVCDDLLGAAILDVILDRVELVGDLVEDREAVVEEIIQHFVEEAARSLAEELLAETLVLLNVVEQPPDRQQVDIRDRDEIVGAEEKVELAGVQALNVLVVGGEVEDAEEVAVIDVVVDLRPLPLRQDVLDVEWMPAEPLAEAVDRLGIDRRLEMDPGKAVGAELSDAWFRARCGRLGVLARPRPPDAGQAGHRY